MYFMDLLSASSFLERKLYASSHMYLFNRSKRSGSNMGLHFLIELLRLVSLTPSDQDNTDYIRRALLSMELLHIEALLKIAKLLIENLFDYM